MLPGLRAEPAVENRPSFALDSTKLISADSFLFAGDDDLRDPSAASDFRYVVDLFCNETEPYFASPRGGKRQPHATPLLALWQDSAVRCNVFAVELDDEALFAAMAPIFAREAVEHTGNIAAWLRYQLSTKDLVEVFWEGKNEPSQLESALGHIERFIDQQHPLSKAISNLPVTIDPRFQSRLLNTKLKVCISYAFLAFRKGRDYVYKLPSEPVYVPHWLRINAQPDHEDGYEREGMKVLPEKFFPWGDVLTRLMAQPAAGFKLSAGVLPEMLSEIRKRTIDFKPYLERHYSGAEARLHNFVLTTLHDTSGWLPPNAKPNFQVGLVGTVVKEVLKQWLPLAAKHVGLPPGDAALRATIGGTLEMIAYSINKKYLKSAAFFGRRLYMRLNPDALALYRQAAISDVVRVYLNRVSGSAPEQQQETAKHPHNSSNEEIERLAFYLWQKRGKPVGSPDVDWLEAERRLGNAADEGS
jgi:hypothetical protein